MRKIQQQNKQAAMIIILIGCLLLFWVPLVAAQDNSSEMSTDEHLFIQGVVKWVALEKRIITLKPSKQERIKIAVDEQTDFLNLPNLEELKKGQQIKVWYTAIGEENRAIKIERLPDLGC